MTSSWAKPTKIIIHSSTACLATQNYHINSSLKLLRQALSLIVHFTYQWRGPRLNDAISLFNALYINITNSALQSLSCFIHGGKPEMPKKTLSATLLTLCYWSQNLTALISIFKSHRLRFPPSRVAWAAAALVGDALSAKKNPRRILVLVSHSQHHCSLLVSKLNCLHIL